MIKRRNRPRRQRKSTLAELRRELWRRFRDYVKERDGGVCFTCGVPGLEGRNHHAGHCISSGSHGSVRYDPKNVHSQCARCNLWLGGNTAEYVARLIQRYGQAEFDRLLTKSREIKQWTRPEIEYLLEALARGGAEFEMAYYERYL